MRIFYEKPEGAGYNRWRDDGGVFDIWYSGRTELVGYRGLDIPRELIDLLDRWCEKMEEYKKSFRESYPARMTRIEFIYKDNLYSLTPKAISATYTTDFMSKVPYEVEWCSLFEAYEGEIRHSLSDELGVTHSRYFGYLD